LQIEELYQGYKQLKQKLQNDNLRSKMQQNLLLYGIVKRTFNCCVLTTFSRLNEAVSHSIINFKEYGESWANFERWQKQKRKVRFRMKVWEAFVKN